VILKWYLKFLTNVKFNVPANTRYKALYKMFWKRYNKIRFKYPVFILSNYIFVCKYDSPKYILCQASITRTSTNNILVFWYTQNLLRNIFELDKILQNVKTYTLISSKRIEIIDIILNYRNFSIPKLLDSKV